jgi:hypothetical protein
MTLEEARASIGLPVVYDRKGCHPEQGVITAVNDRWVMVRYGSESGSAFTDAADLERVVS